jgi:hypothetical protein
MSTGLEYETFRPEPMFRRIPVALFTKSGGHVVHITYPHHASFEMLDALSKTNRISSLSRINNDQPWKEHRTMYTPLYVLEAHIQAVDSKRFQQARQAELIRLARQGQQGPANRLIASIRRSSGSALVAVGQWLQRTPADRVAQELEAMSVTRSQASSS